MLTTAIDPNMTMSELLSAYPGAQRALFRKYHIGGCSSCGFRPDETLAQVCSRNGDLSVAEVAEHVATAHEADQRWLVSPSEAAELVSAGKARLLDVRTREEYDAVHIDGATFFTQQLMHELPGWDRDTLLIFVDHVGARTLDAVAYFVGHGVENVRALRGGIDAWSCEVDPSLPRYELE
jgi:rhodanese-related sulfurtransferase